jgi:hypothetical protein
LCRRKYQQFLITGFQHNGMHCIKVLSFCLKYISMWWIGLLNLTPANKFRPYVMWYPYCVYFYRRFIPATNWTLTVFGGWRRSTANEVFETVWTPTRASPFLTYMRKKREIFVDKFKCCYLPRLYRSNLLNVKFGGRGDLIPLFLSFLLSFSLSVFLSFFFLDSASHVLQAPTEI